MCLGSVCEPGVAELVRSLSLLPKISTCSAAPRGPGWGPRTKFLSFPGSLEEGRSQVSLGTQREGVFRPLKGTRVPSGGSRRLPADVVGGPPRQEGPAVTPSPARCSSGGQKRLPEACSLPLWARPSAESLDVLPLFAAGASRPTHSHTLELGGRECKAGSEASRSGTGDSSGLRVGRPWSACSFDSIFLAECP